MTNLNSSIASLEKDCKLLEPMISSQRIERFNQVLEHRTNYITLVMDGIGKEHNFAAITRTADAFGVMCVHSVGPQIIINSGISMGTDRWIELITHPSSEAAIEKLKQGGYQIVTLCAPNSKSARLEITGQNCKATSSENEDSASCSILDIQFDKPTALVFGNEKNGVSRDFLDCADWQAYIPMCGFVESLNVSVAAGICMFTTLSLLKARLPNSIGLSYEEKLALKLSWLKRDVAGSDLILNQQNKVNTLPHCNL